MMEDCFHQSLPSGGNILNCKHHFLRWNRTTTEFKLLGVYISCQNDWDGMGMQITCKR